MQANAEMVADFVREVVGSPAVLVGNSMGGMVSLLLTAAHPDLVEGLALVDPSIPVPRQRPDLQVAAQFALYATPFVGERYLEGRTRRLSDRQRVLSVVDLCFADPSKADPEVIDAGVALAAHRPDRPGRGRLPRRRPFVDEVLAASGSHKSLIGSITKPVLLIHGQQDRLVRSRPLVWSQPTTPPGRPSSFLESGTPQLEVPTRSWLGSRGGSRSTSLTRTQSALGHEHGLRHLPSL